MTADVWPRGAKERIAASEELVLRRIETEPFWRVGGSLLKCSGTARFHAARQSPLMAEELLVLAGLYNEALSIETAIAEFSPSRKYSQAIGPYEFPGPYDIFLSAEDSLLREKLTETLWVSR